MGTNVGHFRDWAAEYSFKDAGRRIRAFVCAAGTCTYDSNGWPLTGTNETRVFTGGARGKFPTGDYHVFYIGAGSITYVGGTRDAAQSTAGHDVVTVTNNNQDFGYRTVGAMRDIKVIMPGGDCGNPYDYVASAAECSQSSQFRPNYITYVGEPVHPLVGERYGRYAAIRFQWWSWGAQNYTGTVECPAMPWSSRAKPTDAVWAGKGVPVEYMVIVANYLNADAWFTIPHCANDLHGPASSADPFTRQFAQYVRDNLRSNLKAYIEYSNETWNGNYAVAQYLRSEGVRLGVAENPNDAQLRYYAEQSVKLFGIWNDVFNGRNDTRLVRLLSTQSANPWTGLQVMQWQNANLQADALTIAPYFNTRATEELTVQNYSVDEYFNYINTQLLPQKMNEISSNAANASQYGLSLMAYEGGQHLVESPAQEGNRSLNVLYDAANRDPRMRTVYDTYLNGWRTNGGTLMAHFLNVMHYDVGHVGRFGALESMSQNSSPKYDAIMDFISRNPKWW